MPKKEPAGSFFFCSGFSLVELVVIIVIIGVLSIFVTARMSDHGARTRAAYDELRTQVQYARRVAIAQRRTVCVHVGAAQSQLYYSNAAGDACPASAGVAAPAGEVPFTVVVPSGVAVTPATFQFDALGRQRSAAGALVAAPLVISLSGDGTHQFRIEHETGYVR
jgi:MSHA pilin protein MshC